MDGVLGLGQTIDEDPRKLRLEAGAVADFMDSPGLPLPRGPELVDVIGEAVFVEDLCFRAEGVEPLEAATLTPFANGFASRLDACARARRKSRGTIRQ